MAFKKYTDGVVNYVLDHYECECSSSEHTLKFRYFIDEDMEPKIYVDIHLSNHMNFFKRLWNGIKYIFGHRSRYGDFDEFIFKEKDIEDLKTLIIEFEKAKKLQ